MDSLFQHVMLLIFVVVLVNKSLVKVQENERVVITAFGKIVKLLRPGLNMITPIVHKPIVVNLNKHVSGWTKMAEDELAKQVFQLVRENPDPKAFK